MNKTQPRSITSAPKKKSKVKLLVVVLLTLALIAGVGYAAYQHQHYNPHVESSISSEVPIEGAEEVFEVISSGKQVAGKENFKKVTTFLKENFEEAEKNDIGEFFFDIVESGRFQLKVSANRELYLIQHGKVEAFKKQVLLLSNVDNFEADYKASKGYTIPLATNNSLSQNCIITFYDDACTLWEGKLYHFGEELSEEVFQYVGLVDHQLHLLINEDGEAFLTVSTDAISKAWPGSLRVITTTDGTVCAKIIGSSLFFMTDGVINPFISNTEKESTDSLYYLYPTTIEVQFSGIEYHLKAITPGDVAFFTTSD